MVAGEPQPQVGWRRGHIAKWTVPTGRAQFLAWSRPADAPAILFLVAPATALLADSIFREHLAGREHPERLERFDAVMRGLRQAGLLERLPHATPAGAWSRCSKAATTWMGWPPPRLRM